MKLYRLAKWNNHGSYVTPTYNRECIITPATFSSSSQIAGAEGRYNNYGMLSPKDMSDINIRWTEYDPSTLDATLRLIRSICNNGSPVSVLMTDAGETLFQHMLVDTFRDDPVPFFTTRLAEITIKGKLFPYWLSEALNTSNLTSSVTPSVTINHVGTALNKTAFDIRVTPTGGVALHRINIYSNYFNITWINLLNPLAVGDVIIFDVRTNRVYRASNPTVNERKYLSAATNAMALIAPGSNTINVRGYNGVITPVATATQGVVYWNNLWL